MERHEFDQLLGEIEIPDPIHNGFKAQNYQQQLLYSLQQQQQPQLVDPLESSFSRLNLSGKPRNGFQPQSPVDNLAFRLSPSSSYDSSSSGGQEDLSPELHGYSLWNYPETDSLSLFQQQVFQKLHFPQPQQNHLHLQQNHHLQQQQQNHQAGFFDGHPPGSRLHIPRSVPGGAFHNYLHSGKQIQPVRLENPGIRTVPACRFFLQGFCGRGEACPYRHSGRGVQFKNHHQQSRSLNVSRKMSPELKIFSEQLQHYKYECLEEIEGKMAAAAKDQHGCRFLQKKFEEGSEEEVGKIFAEVLEQVADLMTDPFGNYLVQKLLELCSDIQCGQILRAVTRKGELVNISLNMHGTRAVQKLIEILKAKAPEQIPLVINSLRGNVVTLINDLNGNHVIQKCLELLSSENIQFIIDVAAEKCMEIATHRHGCCVLQRCVKHASEEQLRYLVSQIARHALALSQDQYGNYVVQFVLGEDMGQAVSWSSVEVMARLQGNFALLSMQKFSSNVVEKCLSTPQCRDGIIVELIRSPLLLQLLQDPFANYVIQSALTESKGAMHSALVEAIRPHAGVLRSSPYGKRILSRANIKK